MSFFSSPYHLRVLKRHHRSTVTHPPLFVSRHLCHLDGWNTKIEWAVSQEGIEQLRKRNRNNARHQRGAPVALRAWAARVEDVGAEPIQTLNGRLQGDRGQHDPVGDVAEQENQWVGNVLEE